MLASGAKNNTPLAATTIVHRPYANIDEWVRLSRYSSNLV